MKRIIFAVTTLAIIAGCSSQKGVNYAFDAKASSAIQSELISPLCPMTFALYTKEGLEIAERGKASNQGMEAMQELLSKPIDSLTPLVISVNGDKLSINNKSSTTIQNGQVDSGSLLTGKNDGELVKVTVTENQLTLDSTKASAPLSGCIYVFAKK